MEKDRLDKLAVFAGRGLLEKNMDHRSNKQMALGKSDGQKEERPDRYAIRTTHLAGQINGVTRDLAEGVTRCGNPEGETSETWTCDKALCEVEEILVHDTGLEAHQRNEEGVEHGGYSTR